MSRSFGKYIAKRLDGQHGDNAAFNTKKIIAKLSIQAALPYAKEELSIERK